jgi:hypothetical protein
MYATLHILRIPSCCLPVLYLYPFDSVDVIIRLLVITLPVLFIKPLVLVPNGFRANNALSSQDYCSIVHRDCGGIVSFL